MFILGIALLLSGCSSNAASGAYVGGQFGHVIGSAIGGISGGWRGHHTGSLIGTVGGVVAGAAIGSAVDHAQEKKRQEAMGVRDNASRHKGGSDNGSRGRGDDRISFDGGMTTNSYAAPSALHISNVQLLDASRDGKLTRGETARVVFEIRNASSSPVYGVQPSVYEVSGNKHIHISENILVECIQPRETIRYTAQIKADNGLRNGEAVIRVSMFQAGREITSQVRQLRIATSKR